jgi:hypothetical protein
MAKSGSEITDLPKTKSFVPDVEDSKNDPHSADPHSIHRNASWGAIISITIILTMVIVGAFYSWGQRISQERALEAQLHSGQ